ncbi:MAG: hypothetical protein H6545_00080 [Bacteroidales bacterium]|nr:hypothetical protein [Bacteroidales bacterium]
MKPKQGTDAALGTAMGHAIPKEFYLNYLRITPSVY